MIAESLPEGWQIKSLSEVSAAIQYGHTAKASQEVIGPRMLRITDIQGGTVNWGNVPYCSIDEKNKNKYLLKENDLVFARTGATVGKSYLIRGNVPESVYASYLIRVRLTESVDPKYVAYFFQSSDYWAQISKSQAGIGQPNVNGKKLAAIRVPVAPLDQQKHIVAEIEKQFSRLDEAIANLKRVKANLKRYKAAVLKAAVEGRLVETEAELASREGRSYETGEQLLQCILETRRSQWKGKGKYKEPTAPDTTDLPELPEGWKWATVEQISSQVQYGYTASAITRDSGVRFLRITDIQDDRVDWSTVPSCDITEDEKCELLLKTEDIVFARTGATVGKSFQLKGSFPDSVFASYLIRISPHDEKTSDWLNLFFHSSEYWRQIRSSQVGIGQPNVNGTRLKGVIVPLPPIGEQGRINSEIDRRLTLVREVEAILDVNHLRAGRLRQSILMASFTCAMTGATSHGV